MGRVGMRREQGNGNVEGLRKDCEKCVVAAQGRETTLQWRRVYELSV